MIGVRVLRRLLDVDVKGSKASPACSRRYAAGSEGQSWSNDLRYARLDGETPAPRADVCTLGLLLAVPAPGPPPPAFS